MSPLNNRAYLNNMQKRKQLNAAMRNAGRIRAYFIGREIKKINARINKYRQNQMAALRKRAANKYRVNTTGPNLTRLAKGFGF